jgi:hypothetical protein
MITLGNLFHDDSSDKAYVIFVLGQSNAAGRSEISRLANTQYNYKGISTGYPTVRVAQAQYVSNPSNVYIYYKGDGSLIDTNLFPDNGAWAAYSAATNATFDIHATIPTANYFGPELSLATKIADATGKKVYIVKCAVGGTGLIFDTATSLPGVWNYVMSNLAMNYFIRRAARDLKIYDPGKKLVPLTVLWWQGEQDAINGASSATYQSEFAKLKTNIDNAILDSFNLRQSYLWNLVKLSYNRDAAETTINTAITNIVSANSDCRTIDISAYPRKFDLSTGEASPVTANPTTGITTPTNSAGGVDNFHASYIGMLSVGELAYANISSLL